MTKTNTQHTYAFIFGTHPELSAAELKAVLRGRRLEFEAENLVLKADIGWVTTRAALDAADIMNVLGGTVKIVEVVGMFDEDAVADYILDRVKEGSKFHFGFSVYPLEAGIPTKKYWKPMQALGLALKRVLKNEGISARFVSSKEVVLSSVIVHKERLLKNGVEIVVMRGHNELLFGATVAVQPFQDFSHRDYGRPQRDDASGMLPPKLARMMLNLSELRPNSVVYDPFCGSGTVMQEALLLGVKQVVGSDKSRKAVEDAEANIQWLRTDAEERVRRLKERKPRQGMEIDPADLVIPKFGKSSVFVGDATSIGGHAGLKNISVDRIVFEGYLGPVTPSIEKLALVQDELQTMYRRAFQELARLLPSGGRMVAGIPFWNHVIKADPAMRNDQKRNQETHMAIDRVLKNAGLELEQTLLYRRPQSVVGREILVLKKK